MVDNEQIKDIIKHFENEDGANVRVRDIAFTLLSKMFADGKTAYQCLFGADGYDEYMADGMRDKLAQYMTDAGYIRGFSTDDGTGGISFEENRREMERLLAQTQQALDNGLIEAKDGLRIMADIRVKLTDKFKVESQKRDRMIIVEKKFSGICEYCHHEIYVPSEEELMEKYGLIKK